MPVYNWLRIILTILSFLSFIPQIHRIISKKSSVDISLTYILLNTILTTEQFALGFFYVATHNDDSDFFVHDPRDVGDWLNLAQLTVVWVLSLVLFATCLFYAPSIASRMRTVALYTSFLLISIIPLFIDILLPTQNAEDERWSTAIFHYIHTTLINPLVTFGGIASLYFQYSKAGADTLSEVGLASQAVVFAFVAISWIGKVRFWPDNTGERALRDFPFKTWYELVGWAAVDNAVFAMVQGVLYVLRRGQKGSGGLGGEAEPLLGH